MDKKTWTYFAGSFFITFGLVYGLTALNNPRPPEVPDQTYQPADTVSEPEPEVTETGPLIDTSAEPPVKTIKIAFTGDMMFDRYIRQVAEERGYGYIMEQMESYLNKLDLVVGNLEGPVTTKPSESIGTTSIDPGHFVFTFSPNILPVLENAGFQAVNIGNNHIMNFGSIGLEETRTFLDSYGIHFFGDPYSEKYRTTGLLVDTVAVGFVNYNQFENPNVEQTLADIDSFRSDADLIVVFTHWGDEYELEPNARQIELAHQFVDAGADLIIGTHPHVVQNKERYRGKYIYYSLGNFIFDQYFDDNVKCGAIAEIHINPEMPESYTVEEKFISLEPTGQTVPSDCMTEVPLLER